VSWPATCPCEVAIVTGASFLPLRAAPTSSWTGIQFTSAMACQVDIPCCISDGQNVRVTISKVCVGIGYHQLQGANLAVQVITHLDRSCHVCGRCFGGSSFEDRKHLCTNSVFIWAIIINGRHDLIVGDSYCVDIYFESTLRL
jgi:hypothetical protein